MESVDLVNMDLVNKHMKKLSGEHDFKVQLPANANNGQDAIQMNETFSFGDTIGVSFGLKPNTKLQTSSILEPFPYSNERCNSQNKS